MFGKTKIKSAFRNARKLPAIEKDFSGAAAFGNIYVGKDALFVEDISLLYIPLDELASIQLDVQDAVAGTCCNLSAITTHDVTLSTHSGESMRFKIVNVVKAYKRLAARACAKRKNQAFDNRRYRPVYQLCELT